MRAGGDPYRMLRMHPIDDYTPNHYMSSGCPRSPVIMMALDEDLQDHAAQVGQAVYDMFTFAGEEDKAKVAEQVLGFSDRIWQRFWEIDNPSCQMFNGLFALLQDTKEDLDTHSKLELLNNWENYWLMETDMGLVWRTYLELLALGDYAGAFPHWGYAQTKPLGSDQLLVDCTWKKAS